MNDLATFAMDAHGGLDRWRRLKTVSARLLQGGVLWTLKEVPTKHRIFGRQPDGKTAATPLVVSIDLSEVEFK